MSSEEFARHTREILKELIRGTCESLELEENYMEELFNLENCHQVVVGNLYPPCPQPELALGIPPHSDSGILTLLMQNSSFPGLQVMHNGQWIPHEPIPNTFFILVSDLLEVCMDTLEFCFILCQWTFASCKVMKYIIVYLYNFF